MEIGKINDNWKLKSIEINFQKGFNFESDPEKQIDRYEGMIKFENDERESFSFRIKPDMAQQYINLIAQDIVVAATGLGERLKESLGLNK